MLSAFILFVIAFLIFLGAFGTILSIGKPRKPVTPGLAAGVVLVATLEILALAYLTK